uniref:Ig-like domain-containing protein n=1 Tax=Heterorhabditis bacteriophora TaxID=37862 RepID=A0A1I7WE31_HETBA
MLWWRCVAPVGPIIAQMPIIKSVGDEVYLSCNSPITSTIARWERVNGNLSEEAEFNLGVLRLPRIRKEDEGVSSNKHLMQKNMSTIHFYSYKCTVGEDEHQAMSQVELQINGK